jgi:hypothetical protein
MELSTYAVGKRHEMLTIESAYTLQTLGVYGSFLSKFLSAGTQAINNMTSNLLFGLADPAGHHIWDWFKDASFASLETQPANGPNANFTQQFATDFMGTIVTAGGINALWKASNVYIVASPAQNNDCANDKRVPSNIKYCRTDVSDNNIYGIYT